MNGDHSIETANAKCRTRILIVSVQYYKRVELQFNTEARVHKFMAGKISARLRKRIRNTIGDHVSVCLGCENGDITK